MIALDGDDVEIAYLGLPRVETRALDAESRRRLADEIARARPILIASIVLPTLGALLFAADAFWRIDTHGLGVVGAIAVLLSPVAIGYGYSAYAQMRRLERDLADGQVDVFRGEIPWPRGDAAAEHLVRVGRFASAVEAWAEGRTIPVEIALTRSGLPVPRESEKLSRHIARPTRVARPPSTLAQDGSARRPTVTERQELLRHAAVLRQWTIAEGAVAVWGVLAISALFTGSGFGSAFGQIRALVVTGVAVYAMTRVVSRRRFARELEQTVEILGTGDGEALPCGALWTIAGAPAPWRRA